MNHILKGMLNFVRGIFINVKRTFTSMDGLKAFYSVSLYRNAVYLILNSGFTSALGFAFWILAARLYSDEEVGLVSAAIAAAAFLVTLSNFGLDFGLVRFLSNSDQRSNAMVNSCFTIGGLVALASSLIFLAGVNIWSPALTFLRQNPLLSGSFVVGVVAWAIHVLLHNVFVAHQRSKFTLLQGIIQSITKLILIVSLSGTVYGFGILTSWGISFAAAVAVGLLFLLPRLQRGYYPLPTIKKEVVKEIAHFSLANYAVGLVGRISGFILPLMIINLLGPEQSAYFYIASAVISNGLMLIPAGISLSLFAEGSHDEEYLGDYIRKSLKFSFLILVPLIILVFLIGDKILLLFGKAYSQEATKLLWILALSSPLAAINGAYFCKKRVEKKMKSVILLNALTEVIGLGLSYLLIPVMGIMGAGIASLASYGAITLLVLPGLLIKERQ